MTFSASSFWLFNIMLARLMIRTLNPASRMAARHRGESDRIRVEDWSGGHQEAK